MVAIEFFAKSRAKLAEWEAGRLEVPPDMPPSKAIKFFNKYDDFRQIWEEKIFPAMDAAWMTHLLSGAAVSPAPAPASQRLAQQRSVEQPQADQRSGPVQPSREQGATQRNTRPAPRAQQRFTAPNLSRSRHATVLFQPAPSSSSTTGRRDHARRQRRRRAVSPNRQSHLATWSHEDRREA